MQEQGLHGQASAADVRLFQGPWLVVPGGLVTAAVCLLGPSPAEAAMALHAEPANALSLPTWAIHVSRCTACIGQLVSVQPPVMRIHASHGIISCHTIRRAVHPALQWRLCIDCACSVLEWTAAMALVWRYADVSGRSRTFGVDKILEHCARRAFRNARSHDAHAVQQDLHQPCCMRATWRHRSKFADLCAVLRLPRMSICG